MALQATLQFGDNGFRRYARAYNLMDFKCHVLRRHNEARPDGGAHCERMELTVVVPGREDLSLYEWYIEHSTMSGRILIELPVTTHEQNSALKEVLFEDAHCYSISEEYHIDRRIRRSLTLKIVATEITVDDIVFKSR